MILGNIEHLELVPYLPHNLKKAIEFIKTEIHAQTPDGRYDIDGDNVFFIVSENQPRRLMDANPEFHKNYIDIQIVLEGEEMFGVCFQNANQEKIIEDYSANKDIAFIQTPAKETNLLLRAGDFVIFYPHEIHKPLGFVDEKINKIKKVVVKVALDSL